MQIGELDKEKERTWLLNKEMVIKIDGMCENGGGDDDFTNIK